VTLLCDVIGVSPAGYYDWRSRPESRRSAANREMLQAIPGDPDPAVSKELDRDLCWKRTRDSASSKSPEIWFGAEG